MADTIQAFEIKSFTGLSDYEDRGIKGAFKFGSNLDVRKAVDSLSAGQALIDEGTTAQSASASRSPSASASPSASRSPSSSVSPSPSPSAGLKTVFADLIRWFVKCSDGNTYGFGNTGKVYKRTSDPMWTQVYDLRKQIKGACEKPSATTTYLLMATDTELHIKPIPGLSNWNDVNTTPAGWPKTNLTSADWHTMTEVGGDVHIANKNTLAFVGYDDSYTNNALDLIPGNIAKTIVERNGRAVIGTYKAADPDKGINAAIDAEVPLAQVGDEGGIYFANMVDTLPVKVIPGGGKVNPGGIANKVEQVNFFEWETTALSWIDKQTVGNLALFGVYGGTSGKGGIYSYGRTNKNKPFVLNCDHLFDADEIGAVTVVDGTILFSYRSGSSFGVKAVDSTAKATATWEGLDLMAPVKTPVNITTWNTAEIYMAPLPSGASLQFWYKLNKTGSFIQAYTADGSTSYSTASSKKAVFRIGEQAEIFEPKVVLIPTSNSTPEVYRIRLYFS